MAGHLYVLINPTFQHLVKVGQTCRDVEIRCAELSATTGLPTAFIVAYKKKVANPALAEKLVHKELDFRGHRNRSNREFFNVPLSEVVEIIQDVISSNSDILFIADGSELLVKDENSKIQLINKVWSDLELELSIPTGKSIDDTSLTEVDDYVWQLLSDKKNSIKLSFLVTNLHLPAFPIALAENILRGDMEAAASTLNKVHEIISADDDNFGLFPSNLTEMVLYIFCTPYLSVEQIEKLANDDLISQVIPSAKLLSILDLAKFPLRIKYSSSFETSYQNTEQDISSLFELFSKVSTQNEISEEDYTFLKKIVLKKDLIRAAQISDIALFFSGMEINFEINFTGSGPYYDDDAKAALEEIKNLHKKTSSLFSPNKNFAVFSFDLVGVIDELFSRQEKHSIGSSMKERIDKFLLTWQQIWTLAELDGILIDNSNDSVQDSTYLRDEKIVRKLKCFSENFPNISNFLISNRKTNLNFHANGLEDNIQSIENQNELDSAAKNDLHESATSTELEKYEIKKNGTCNVCHQRIFMFRSQPNRKVFYNVIGHKWEPHPCIEDAPDIEYASKRKRNFLSGLLMKDKEDRLSVDVKSRSANLNPEQFSPIQLCSPVKTNVSPTEIVNARDGFEAFDEDNLWQVRENKKLSNTKIHKLTLSSLVYRGKEEIMLTDSSFNDIIGSVLFKDGILATTFDFDNCRPIQISILNDQAESCDET